MSQKLFQTITDTLPKMEGWCDVPKGIVLAALIIEMRPSAVLEIGVFGGRSLLAMALACKECGSGFVCGVDPWAAQESIKDQTPENLDWWKNVNHEEIYASCKKFISDAGVEKQVRLLRLTSDAALPRFNGIVFDLIHCDGNHGEPAYRDAVNYAPLLRRGGYWIADDMDWSGGGVTKGVDYLIKNGFVELFKLGTGAVFQKSK